MARRNLSVDELARLEARIGLVFRKKELLRVALSLKRNLDWIGDKLLSVVIFEIIEEHDFIFSALNVEKLVSNRALSVIAERIGLFFYVDHGSISEERFYRTKRSADVVEALVGAAWKDQGAEGIRKMVRHLYTGGDHSKSLTLPSLWNIPELVRAKEVALVEKKAVKIEELSSAILPLDESLESCNSNWQPDDPRCKLYSLCTERLRATPRYCARVLEMDGEFVAHVYCRGLQLGRGKGAVEESSHLDAARDALQKIESGELQF
jgi:dsRNA-specific ribonuclease